MKVSKKVSKFCRLFFKVSNLGLKACVFLFLNTALVHADLGFHPLNSQSTPPPVRDVGQKALEIWNPVSLKFIELKDVPALKTQVEERLSGVAKQVFNAFNNPILDYCVEKGIQFCPFWEELSRGSAFVLEGNKLVTARHNFSSEGKGMEERFTYLSLYWESRVREGHSPEAIEAEIKEFERNPLASQQFILTDSRGELVYNTINDGSRFLKFGNEETIRAEVSRDKLGDLSNAIKLKESQDETPLFATIAKHDIAVVELSKPLPSLDYPESQCVDGEKVFAVGYPGKTINRENYGARDSLGRELSFSQGHQLSSEEARVNGRNWSNIDRFVDDSKDQPVWKSSADSTVGSSGSVLVNREGKVCGVLAGILPKSEEFEYDADLGRHLMFSYGRRLTDLRHLFQNAAADEVEANTQN